MKKEEKWQPVIIRSCGTRFGPFKMRKNETWNKTETEEEHLVNPATTMDGPILGFNCFPLSFSATSSLLPFFFFFFSLFGEDGEVKKY